MVERRVWDAECRRFEPSRRDSMLSFVLGTRPELIKARPLLLLAKKRKIATRVILTGQHTDLAIGTGVKANIYLNIPSENDPEAYVNMCVDGLKDQYTGSTKDTIVVIGDTASALAGARYGNQAGIPVAHVEAGLRSGDEKDPWPEEGFRKEIDQLATYHFCPTEGNFANLQSEGVGQWIREEIPGGFCATTGRIITGNTIVDALRLGGFVRTPPKGYVLVTLHRRESFGEPLRNILIGLRNFAISHPSVPILWPLHPNPAVGEALRAVPMPVNVMLRGPVPYSGFVELLCSATCVLTDSGGVIEEATTLGVPIVCARNKTERPEAFTVPWNALAGTHAMSVEGYLRQTFHATGEPFACFGTGYASEAILEVMC